MKTKRALVGIAVATLVCAIILISLRAYYVLAAIMVGTLIMGHRELWSLIRTRNIQGSADYYRRTVHL